MNRVSVVICIFLLSVCSPSVCSLAAQEKSPVGDVATFRQRVTPFFQKHCTDCHGPDSQEGDLRLDTLAADFLNRQPAGKWVEVLDRLNLGEMPPADEARPDANEIVAVTAWITNELRRVQSLANSTGGQVLLRRLSRTEYANTVRDLFGVTFIEGEGPMEMLPPDGTIHGFNKVSKGLLLDPSLMEMYFQVAEFVVQRAVATRPPKVPSRTLRFDFEDIGDTAMKYQVQSRSMWLANDGIVMAEGGARTFGKLLHPFNNKQTPIDGEYLIRVRAGADPGKRGEPIYMDFTKGAAGTLARIRVDATFDKPQVYEVKRVLNAALGGELNIGMVNGTRTHGENRIGREARMEIEKLFNEGKKAESFRFRARRRAEGAFDTYTRGNIRPETLNLETLPKLYLDYVELEGPLNGRWPPDSRRRLFEHALGANRWTLGEQSADGMSRDEMLVAARKVFSKLLPRAFRRNVQTTEIDQLVDLVVSELDADQPFEDAVKVGLIAMLCSPDFLYLFEPSGSEASVSKQRAIGEVRDFKDRRGRTVRGKVVSVEGDVIVFQRATDQRQYRLTADVFSAADQRYIQSLTRRSAAGKARTLTDFELASRLSYFLWSSMPDDELFSAAQNGRLRQPEALNVQIDRMLADERAEALVTDFASQWLRLNEFDRFEPDRRIFPNYYANEFAGIGEEMKTEPLAFFREVLRNNLSVLNVLDADWTMANEKLAKWYGIDGVSGKEFQKTAIPADSPRGGLLGMAGVHKWGSDGNRTKPVERGKYILDVLFNDPPPPPPPNAGEVEPNIRGQNLTVRQRLEKHRHVATCANCHRRIDPYGLALENFNVIGRWRDKLDGEKPIEHWGRNRPAIVNEGILPNGRQYKGFVEFKAAIKAQGKRFERGLAEKMMVYALGRSLEPSDDVIIQQIVANMESEQHTLKSLIKSIVRTEAFQTK